VDEALVSQLADLPTKEVALPALFNNSYAVLVSSLEEGIFFGDCSRFLSTNSV
jgi:hypothetical protein